MIFNLECIYTIFSGITPRIAIAEMDVDLPCHAQAYLAETASECFQEASKLRENRPKTLSMLYTQMSSESDGGDDAYAAIASAFDLYVTILGKY